MTRLAAAQILDEDSENLVGLFSSKPEVARVGILGAKKDNNGGSDAAGVDKETLSTSGKFGVGDVSGEGIGGTSILDSGINGLVAREGKNSDGNFSCTDNDSRRQKERGMTINLNASDVSGEGMGMGRWNGERLEDQNHGFRVGDFVWGKIKNDPWWPGQVYDPRDASEFALKHSQEGRVLVAFFGDGSCSWCLPSQLSPFVENLEEKSSDGSSKGLLNAVQMAVDEIGRIVESRILCRCIPLERRDNLARPIVSNAGIRAGVLVPEVGIDRLPIPEYEPAELLAKVTDFARTGSFDSVFELAVLRSWVSAYYYGKYGSQLQVYSEPRVIEGLEDKFNGETAVYNLSGPMAVPSQGPMEDDWLSSPTGSSAKSKAPSDEKICRRRKQKSVTELMDKKRSVKPKTRRTSAAKEGKDDGKVERGGSLGGSLIGKRDRKRRDDDALVVKPNEIEVAPVEANVQAEIGSTPRERKKSKYLSPPYTNLHGRVGFSGYKPDSDVDELTETSQDLSASPVPELDDKTSVETNARAAESVKNITYSVSDVDVEVNDLLQKLEFAAVDCLYLRKEGHLDSIWGFISAYRSSTYLHGSDCEVYHKCKRVSHKRKSLASPSSSKPRANKSGSSQPTDDLVSGAKVIRQKLDMMTATLENCCSRFSSDDRSCLKKEMEHLMGKVEKAIKKVRAISEKTTTSS
ncbi:hypothetical protein C2S53_008937 [Perilla frutescens var. hirtella]|uniref:PWWP domain-containing protein n=1 Tax=Perilla frutescens var. hirtella TaxID=608512 RepID=A0AAD4JBP7_PERFH|nr:hypothetical protein C2S53_008937 [Perilla frutescens var. hirtella]